MSAQVASQWRTYRCQSATHVRALRAELHRGHGGCKIPPSQRPLALRSALCPPPLLGTGPEFRSGWPSFARRDALPGTPPPRLPRRPESLSTSAAHSLRTPPSDRAVPAPRRLPLRPSARAPPPKADASFHFFGGQLFKEKSQKSQACGIPHDGTLIRKIFGIITRAAENNRVETQKGAPPGVIIFAGILGHGHEKAGAGFDNRHGGERRRDHGDAKDEDRAVRR